MRVDHISQEDVLAVLTPIWSGKPETVRRCIKATLQWCQAHGLIEVNFASEAIDGALPHMTAVKTHLRALLYRELPAALQSIKSPAATLAARLALRFLILTAARSGEVRGALLTEIDIDSRVWRIPVERMKAVAEHWVQLSD